MFDIDKFRATSQDGERVSLGVSRWAVSQYQRKERWGWFLRETFFRQHQSVLNLSCMCSITRGSPSGSGSSRRVRITLIVRGCKQRVQGNEGNIPADVWLGTVAARVPALNNKRLKRSCFICPALQRPISPHLNTWNRSAHRIRYRKAAAVTCGSAVLFPSTLFLYLQVTSLHTTALHAARSEHTAVLPTAIALSFKRHLT